MTHVPRAQRFDAPMRVLWRTRCAPEWFEAVGLNASRTGVLFQSGRLVDVGTEIELRLALSWETTPWNNVADVNCLGRIVRVETRGSANGVSVLAASIDQYSLARES
jgi:PilZ domain